MVVDVISWTCDISAVQSLVTKKTFKSVRSPTDSRKPKGRLKHSPHPSSLPTVSTFGNIAYSISICMFITFDSLSFLSIQCYMV